MDKPGNIDAAYFFSLEVFLKLHKRYPEAILELLEIRLALEVKELRQISGIVVTAQVSSVIEYLYWARVCVTPISKSMGTKIRSLQTLATSTPLVASDYSLEGLLIYGTGITLNAMRSNGIYKYIYTIICLFEQPKLRKKLSINSLVLIEQEYT